MSSARCPTRTFSPTHRTAPGFAFRACGLVGFAAAVAIATAVCASRGLSLSVQAALIAAAVVTFLTLAMATKIALGREALIYYHHEIAVLAVTALLAWALGAPVASHLDATALGLGAFLACGRVGCLLAGCCHGRPARDGVVYTAAHGVPAFLVGVPLVPVQALEALAALVLVAAGLTLEEPGAALGLYVSGYAAVRFWLETVRGDLWRPYWHGLSAAQWTSLAVAGAVAVFGLPGAPGHIAVAVALTLAAPFVVRRRGPALLGPQHVRELADVLPPPRPGRPLVRETSLGVRCSAGMNAGLVHYTLSRPGAALVPHEAGALARVILWLRHPDDAGDVVPGVAGTYHVLVRR